MIRAVDDSVNSDAFSTLGSKLERIESMLRELVEQKQTAKEFFTTAEAAELLGKRPFTVREWCRHGRVNAEKRECGRGMEGEWMIQRSEIERIRNFGLLPLRKR
jgi:hypothetical protein